MALATRQQSLYILRGQTCSSERAYIIQGPSQLLDAIEPIRALTACSYSSKASMETWHRRLAHTNLNSVRKLYGKDMVRGMEVSGSTAHEADVCKACLEGKQSRKPIPDESQVESPRILHRTYSDICEHMEMTS